MSTSCETTVRRLPFFLNGTLDEGERSNLLDHLASCSRCAGELEETAAAWALFAQHVPSFDLVAHALGITISDSASEQIEDHLAVCESCRAEVEAVLAENVVEFPTSAPIPDLPSVPKTHRGWRLLAAAGLLAMVGSALFLKGRSTLEEFPTLGVEATQAELTESKSAVTEVAQGGDEVLDMALFANGFEEGDIDSWPEVGELR